MLQKIYKHPLAQKLGTSSSQQLLTLGGILLLLGLFFSRATISIGMVVIALSLPLRIREKGLQTLNDPLLLPGLLLFAWLALSYFWTTEAQQEAYWQDLRIKLGLVVLLVGMAGSQITHQQRFKWFITLLLSAGIIAIGSVVNYFLHYEEINEMVSRSKPIPIINGFWHISFSYMLAFSIVMGLYFWNHLGSWRWLIRIMTITQVVVIHILTARTGLLALYCALLFGLLWWAFKRKRLLQAAGGLVAMGVLAVAAVVLVPSLNNRYHNTVHDVQHILKGGNANYHSGAMRVKALQAGWNIFADYPVKGVGLGDLDPAMRQAYDDMDALLLPENQIMPHNQFLNFMVVGGLPAVLCFLAIWGLALWKGMPQGSLLLLWFLVLSFVAMHFEALLQRQIGTAFFGFFIMVLSHPTKNR